MISPGIFSENLVFKSYHFHCFNYDITNKNYNGENHGCQNRNLDRRIARFYDPTSPKRLDSH